MAEQYSLTVSNCSSTPQLKFAVFTTVPVDTNGHALDDPNDPFRIAWIVHQIDQGNQYVFNWQLSYQIMWQAGGYAQGVRWEGHGAIDADPTDPNQCGVQLDYDGDWNLKHKPHATAPDLDKLFVIDTSNVPPYDKKPSSVGLCISAGDDLAPQPAIAAWAGPRLHQTFILHPTYYIAAGSYEQGQMVDVSDMTDWHEVKYGSGMTAASVMLDDENVWHDGVTRCP